MLVPLSWATRQITLLIHELRVWLHAHKWRPRSIANCGRCKAWGDLLKKSYPALFSSAPFEYSEVFLCFYLVLRQIQERNAKRDTWHTPRHPSGTAASQIAQLATAQVWVKKPRQQSNQSIPPNKEKHVLLQYQSRYSIVWVFNEDWKSLVETKSPVCYVCYWAQLCDKTQEWLNRSRDVY
jgi:hypothetical protein